MDAVTKTSTAIVPASGTPRRAAVIPMTIVEPGHDRHAALARKLRRSSAGVRVESDRAALYAHP
jgi:hypothetical protein